jgi:hypothetical protein
MRRRQQAAALQGAFGARSQEQTIGIPDMNMKERDYEKMKNRAIEVKTVVDFRKTIKEYAAVHPERKWIQGMGWSMRQRLQPRNTQKTRKRL